MPDETQEKPVWDRSKPGQPKAITEPVSDEEIAAWKRDKLRMAAGEGRKYLSAESLFYTDNEEAVRENLIRLKAALDEKERSIDAVMAYRFGAATAMANLSMFDEATGIITGDGGRVYPGFTEMAKRIKRLKAAEDLPDDAECKCERAKKILTVTSTVGTASSARDYVVEEQRRQRVGMVFSSSRGAVRHVYECRHCGHLGLHEKAPESHQETVTARRQHEKRFKHAREFDTKEMGHLADQHLLNADR